MMSAAFSTRHIGPRLADQRAMLAAIGVPSIETLISQTIPKSIRLGRPLDLPAPASEAEALAELADKMAANVVLKSFVGLGYHGTITPPVILRNLFENVPDDVRLSVILDNCFSGTATRAPVSEIIPGLRTPDDRRVRFLSPALRGGKVLQNPWKAKPKGKDKHPESAMKDVLLTGCSDKEYSYDANIDGTYHGAMTYYALKAGLLD